MLICSHAPNRKDMHVLCAGFGVSLCLFLFICLLRLCSPKLAEDWCHFCFASTFLCGLRSRRNWSFHCCQLSGITAEHWRLVGCGSRWNSTRLHLGLAQAVHWWVTNHFCFHSSPADQTLHLDVGMSIQPLQ